MENIYLVADTHFGDARILRYENRPFQSVEAMDAEMIERWNAVVSQNDVVYILGDFGADNHESDILSKLHGQKFLVKGNHDVKSNADYRAFGFIEVYDHPIIIDDFWILSHDAMYINDNMPYANLFGHVHNSPIVKDYSKHHYCVSVERINYTPISFDEVKKKIAVAADKEE